MPIYEYVCPSCGQPFEKLVRGGRKAREATVNCPTCGEESHRKEVTLVGALAGSGSISLSSSAANCAPSG
jgi:putative FmdB family regulatory protein